MPRLSLGELPVPPTRNRVDRTENSDGIVQFETRTKCQDEDLARAQLLRRSADRHPDQIDKKAALRLAELLEANASQRQPSESLASSVHMRKQRIRAIGWLWAAYEGRLP